MAPSSALPSPAERRAGEPLILNARPIPERRLQQLGRTAIPVAVRLVWERDGEELVKTVARDWVGRDVLMDVDDRRWPTRGVWLDAGDVRRR